MAGVQRQRTQLGLSDPGVGEIKVGTSSGGSFAQGLLDAANSLNQVAPKYIGEKVEADKVLQANRALKGLMPTEDATTGGTRANMMVGAQNGINEMTMRLKDDAASWQGTEDEWNAHVVQQRNDFEQSIYQKYPELTSDRDTSKLVTNMFMEQQPTIQASKVSADLQREHQDRANTFQTRMTQTTAGKDGVDLTRSLEDLKPIAKALKLSDTEYEQVIAGEAKARAATGDTSMLMATQGIRNAEGVSLYDRDASIRASVIQGQRMDLSLHQTDLANDKYGMEQRFMSGEMSDAELISAASIMNDKYGGAAYSASELNGLRDQKARADAKQGKKVDFVGKIAQGQLVALEDYTEKEINEGAAAYHDQGDAMVEAYAKAKGYTDEQKEGLRAKVQSEVTVNLAKAGIKDQQFVRQIGSFQNIGPDHLKDMKEEPPEMQTLLNRWNTLPDYMRTQVVGEKPAAFLYNYQLGISNHMNPGQAIDFAQKASRDINFSSKDNKEISKTGEDVAGDLISNNGFNPFDNYPDYIRQQMKDFATDDVRRFRKAGFDIDGAKEQASTNLANNYSYVGGTVIRGDKKMLAQKLKLNEEDLGAQFQAYLQVNKQKFEDEAGGPKIDEMYYDIDQQRGIFTVRAGAGGMPVQGARPLSELGNYKWLDQVQKEMGNSKAEMRDRVMKAEGYAFGGPSTGGAAASIGKSVMDALFPPAGAAETQPELQHGEIQKNELFSQYLSTAENQSKSGFDTRAGVFTPYDSDTGTEGTDTVAYGHKLTPDERKNGYIMIDNNPVPYKAGESQLTEQQAQRLLQQDMKSHVPSTPGWKTDFDGLPGNIRRALIDTSFNMGKGFLNKNPTANAWFKQGDYQAGFIQLLTASNENGKRSKGVLVRRASAYNMAGGGDWPKISKVDVGEDGTMRVKFDGNKSSINPQMRSMISDDGWLLVKRGKAGSLHERSTAGTVSI
ncbi:hypothetical protein VLVyarbaL_00012 [Erwinia phage VyarbaL]|nr:hypothetical protein VLVyarbaL_00012 [Erwinia phage VyarbaL]